MQVESFCGHQILPINRLLTNTHFETIQTQNLKTKQQQLLKMAECTFKAFPRQTHTHTEWNQQQLGGATAHTPSCTSAPL